MTSSRNLLDVFLLLTVVDCGSLTDPANGSVNHTAGTIFRQNATYSCNTGYNLVGDSTRTCQATGNWSGSAPTCQGMLLHSVCFMSIHEVMALIGDAKQVRKSGPIEIRLSALAATTL